MICGKCTKRRCSIAIFNISMVMCLREVADCVDANTDSVGASTVCFKVSTDALLDRLRPGHVWSAVDGQLHDYIFKLDTHGRFIIDV